MSPLPLKGVDKSVASRVVAELGAWASDMTPDGVAQSAQRVMALTQVEEWERKRERGTRTFTNTHVLEWRW